jgi:GNAT superfamily N-acetyltransferase
VSGSPQPPTFRSEPLGRQHDRSGFACGVERLDNYLRTQAAQDVRKRVAVVFVLTPDGRTIAGYYALSQYSILLDEAPEELRQSLPRYPQVPATLLGRLARSSSFQGQGVGELLLMDALKRSLTGSKHLGSAGVVVDAKGGPARAFYLKYGFIELPRTPNRLFLPMVTIELLVA